MMEVVEGKEEGLGRSERMAEVVVGVVEVVGEVG